MSDMNKRSAESTSSNEPPAKKKKKKQAGDFVVACRDLRLDSLEKLLTEDNQDWNEEDRKGNTGIDTYKQNLD